MLRSVCRHGAAPVAALTAVLFASAPLATADGPDFYRVIDVAADDVLNVRTEPSARGKKLGIIPPNADGIFHYRCVGGLTLKEWNDASPAEREAARTTRWCLVGYGGVIGWSAAWYLAEGRAPEGVRASDRLIYLVGTEWLLRDAAGQPAAAEAWVAFKAEGDVIGNTGCNTIRANYDFGRAETLNFGRVATTRMACPGTRDKVERIMLRILEEKKSAYGTERLLALLDADGTVMATFTRRDFD